MKTLALCIGSLAAVALLGCQGKTSAHLDTPNGPSTDAPALPPASGGGGGGGGGGGTPTPSCTQGRGYQGFGGMDLTSDRTGAQIGLDRDLLKPYTALVGEYPRVLGNTPGLLPAMAATFSDPPARWYEVQKSNAVSAYSAFRVAFQGCLALTASDAQFAAAPDGNTAPTLCRTWQNTFWSRTPGNDETAACAEFAVTQTTTETNPRRQWAYTCAAVLSAAQFLAY